MMLRLTMAPDTVESGDRGICSLKVWININLIPYISDTLQGYYIHLDKEWSQNS